jgi:hypothetical protein
MGNANGKFSIFLRNRRTGSYVSIKSRLLVEESGANPKGLRRSSFPRPLRRTGELSATAGLKSTLDLVWSSTFFGIVAGGTSRDASGPVRQAQQTLLAKD